MSGVKPAMSRNTLQHQIIIDAVMNLANHPTAEDVYLHAVKKHPAISKATIYRNLAVAAENGEISSAGIFDGAMRFEHRKDEHFHFVCESCKALTDIPCFDLSENLNSLNDLTIKKIELTLRGLCGGCARAADQT